MLRRYSLARWTRNGGLLGLRVAFADITGWRGDLYQPWVGEGQIVNVLTMAGSVLVGALLIFLAALLRNAFARKP